jgi:transposase
MKYLNPLKEEEKRTLKECLENHPSARTRARAHGILLSNRGFKIDEMARVFAVDRDTVSHWLKRWEEAGLVGLYDDPRSGRPAKLIDEEGAIKKTVRRRAPFYEKGSRTSAAFISQSSERGYPKAVSQEIPFWLEKAT